jgi:hypothetical protein
MLSLKPSILQSLKKKDGQNHLLDGLKRLKFLTVSSEINKTTHTSTHDYIITARRLFQQGTHFHTNT